MGSNDINIKAIEQQILEEQRITDHRIREYPIDVLIEKFTQKDENGMTEFFVPDYQRNFIWNKIQQSRFIESILIGIPIPYLFAADTNELGREGYLEIVDGVQRLYTLKAYVNGELALTNLEKLTSLNNTVFRQLSPSRQRRFLRCSLRMIELTELATEETRRDLFERLNSGGTKLTPIEVLRGSITGPLMRLITICSKFELLHEICPIANSKKNRFEYEERVLRFFAYVNNYKQFDHRVDEFLKSFAKNNYDITDVKTENMKKEFSISLQYVKDNFPIGFRRSQNDNNIPRVRFEAILVGVALALRTKKALFPDKISEWIKGDEFKRLTRSDASNNRDKVLDRFEYVNAMLLDENFVSNKRA
jgi:uncharacterized protein with ParB-like and HNH nuclease domain